MLESPKSLAFKIYLQSKKNKNTQPVIAIIVLLLFCYIFNLFKEFYFYGKQ